MKSKSILAVLLFLLGFGVTLLTTPASQAGTVFVNTPGRVFVPTNGCFNGFCNGPFFPNQGVTPVFFNNPVVVHPVIFDTTGVVDNIYGPGASAARRMAPMRNSNFYHGW